MWASGTIRWKSLPLSFPADKSAGWRWRGCWRWSRRILDEPTAGLDPAGRENLLANIRDYHRNKNGTVIMVSHSMEEVARNVDRILVLKSAHVLMQGTPKEVFSRADELLSAGLDVPQITRVAMALKARGLAVDPAVYTAEELERQLMALRKGAAGC